MAIFVISSQLVCKKMEWNEMESNTFGIPQIKQGWKVAPATCQMRVLLFSGLNLLDLPATVQVIKAA